MSETLLVTKKANFSCSLLTVTHPMRGIQGRPVGPRGVDRRTEMPGVARKGK